MLDEALSLSLHFQLMENLRLQLCSV